MKAITHRCENCDHPWHGRHGMTVCGADVLVEFDGKVTQIQCACEGGAPDAAFP